MEQRVIKFRAWYCGKMVHNVGFHPNICMKHQGYKANEDCAYTLSPDFDTVNLMQFTGLLDKVKCEVYEGDYLINPKGEKGIVVRYEGGFYLECPRKSGQTFYVALTKGFMANKTKCGNIYEHPHLLIKTER